MVICDSNASKYSVKLHGTGWTWSSDSQNGVFTSWFDSQSSLPRPSEASSPEKPSSSPVEYILSKANILTHILIVMTIQCHVRRTLHPSGFYEISPNEAKVVVNAL